MKIYALVFLLTCCMFVQVRSSSDWREIVAITLQLREINSIIDKVFLPLKVVAYKKGSLEVYKCYNEAETKLTEIQQHGYDKVATCFKQNKNDIPAGIACSIKSHRSIRKASQDINAEAIECFTDLRIDVGSSSNGKKSSGNFQNRIPILEVGTEDTM